MTALKPKSLGYPMIPATLGQHIRKRRLDLGLQQQAVAAQIGVVEASVWNWENDWSPPARRYRASIIEFLGYEPQP